MMETVKILVMSMLKQLRMIKTLRSQQMHTQKKDIRLSDGTQTKMQQQQNIPLVQQSHGIVQIT